MKSTIANIATVFVMTAAIQFADVDVIPDQPWWPKEPWGKSL